MNETPSDNIIQRMRARLWPNGLPRDDRGRMRLVVNNLILHIHPAKVSMRAMRWTYTWGLGGLAAMLLVLLGSTGILLEINYTPSAPQAYLNILELRSNVWFGELIRNVHHWSANLLVVVTVLHLLRVFFTGAYRPPRETNWLIGVGMLLLVLGGNFTGYLLPWDQLAFWAITVGTSVLTYVPLIGDALGRLLLGGPEVSGATLLNFYSLHISFIPLAIFGLMSFHFWRIRKDGGLTNPRGVDETEKVKLERVTTIPHLVRRELVYALVWLAAILVWAMLVPAPLEGIANPDLSPNPAKAPWYFLGLQELLLHFHPLVGAIIIPAAFFIGLALLPFYDVAAENVGVYFRSHRGRSLTVLATGLSLVSTPLWVALDEFVLHWADWLPAWPSLVSNGLVPLAVVALGLILMDEWVKDSFKATVEERVLFLFTFLFVAIFILTIIGIFFRGPGMSLYWPWAMPVVSH
ncbi:MAG: cytochrome bc complex cytochrome b subunit [Chloroflexi bacterium]|nr:cytochrome bc complex cytochrome b subunit [Chloroflexota bacterium]